MKKEALRRVIRSFLVLALCAGPLPLQAAEPQAEPASESAEAAEAQATPQGDTKNCQGEPGAPCCKACETRARLAGKSAEAGGCPCQRAKAAREAR
jgi:hypothetical protein